MATTNNLKRPEPQALASTLAALAARFGNRLITSQAVRDIPRPGWRRSRPTRW
jgi:D-lactate dehydrogenase (cytochrome)